jgi:hypothetical protein
MNTSDLKIVKHVKWWLWLFDVVKSRMMMAISLACEGDHPSWRFMHGVYTPKQHAAYVTRFEEYIKQLIKCIHATNFLSITLLFFCKWPSVIKLLCASCQLSSSSCQLLSSRTLSLSYHNSNWWCLFIQCLSSDHYVHQFCLFMIVYNASGVNGQQWHAVRDKLLLQFQHSIEPVCSAAQIFH